jgi:hypothetical protein
MNHCSFSQVENTRYSRNQRVGGDGEKLHLQRLGPRWLAPPRQERYARLRQLLSLALVALLVNGCSTTVSMMVDAKPTMTPQELSAELSKRYPGIGLEPRPSDDLRSEFELGTWNVSEGGFVGHGARKGAPVDLDSISCWGQGQCT